jgi:hypothetical protein
VATQPAAKRLTRRSVSLIPKTVGTRPDIVASGFQIIGRHQIEIDQGGDLASWSGCGRTVARDNRRIPLSGSEKDETMCTVPGTRILHTFKDQHLGAVKSGRHHEYIGFKKAPMRAAKGSSASVIKGSVAGTVCSQGMALGIPSSLAAKNVTAKTPPLSV